MHRTNAKNSMSVKIEWGTIVLSVDRETKACTLLHISMVIAAHMGMYIHMAHTILYDTYIYDVECISIIYITVLRLLSYTHLGVLMGCQCYESH